MLESARMFTLASNSPRRKELLSLTGWSFDIQAAPVDERVLPGEAAEDYVRRISLSKARSSLELGSGASGEMFVLACDTSVVDGNVILGKPSDPSNAAYMLRRLRGRVHQVFSALAIIETSNGKLLQELCVTDVPMRDYTENEMVVYIASGDPMDKAGAYAIQHPQFQPVQEMRGCYANVMGLPLCHIARSMQKLDVESPLDIPEACQQYLDYDCPVYMHILRGEM